MWLVSWWCASFWVRICVWVGVSMMKVRDFWVSGIWVFFLVACKSQGKWWMSVLVAGLALLSLRERVVNDPFGALLNWKEEDGVINPCSWYGVECSDGKVVVLWVNFFAFLFFRLCKRVKEFYCFIFCWLLKTFFFF